MSEQQTFDTTAEELPLKEFFRVENAKEQGVEVEPAKPVVEAAAVGAPDEATGEVVQQAEPDGERNTDGTFKKKNRREDPRVAVQSAVAKQREAEREAADLRARIAALEARPVTEPVKPSADTAPVTASDKKRYLALPDAPKLAEYDGSDGKTYEDYSADVAVFIADKRFDERMDAHTAQQAAVSRRTAWDAKMEAAVAKIPDLRTRIQAAAGDRTLPAHIIDYIQKRDSGPEILLHLAEHPADHQRVTTLPLDDAIEALVTIRNTIEGSATTAARSGPASSPVISAASAPIKPVGSSPHVGDGTDDVAEEDLPLAVFMKRGNAKDPSVNPRAARH